MTAPDDASSAFDALADRFVERVRAGDAPDIEAWAREHPALADDIRKLFPLLAMVEGAKAETQVGASSAEGDATMPAEIAGYTIVRELGRGGMGAVYEGARDGSRVAIKTIHPHLVAKSTFMERFLREAEIGTRVEHRNVVRTLAAGTTDDRHPYLVMEFVEGQNLRELLDEVPTVPERLRRHIGARVADALAAIHAQGIVHRDVKPENVVITPDEQVKLMDLGVAFVQDEMTRLSQTGEFVGSLLYAAPEQLRGRDVGPQADLYALGLLLYELATGEHPLRVAGGGALPHTAVESPSAREQNPRVSPFFDEVIQKLLVIEPDARLGDAAAVAEILEAGERSTWWQAQKRPEQSWAARVGYDPLAGHVALVGRDAELALVDDALAEARKGRGQVVAVAGEAGLGKSRLVREWLRRAASVTGLSAVVASHDPEGDTYAVPPLARAFGEVLGPDAPTQRLASLLGPSAGLAEAYGRYLHAEEAGPYGAGLPATAVTTATVRLARGLAQEGPYILVIEDLHFASARARDLCLQVARALADHPVLVLITSRPDVGRDPFDALIGWPHARTLTLEPLDDTACRALLVDLVGDAATKELGALIKRADGNPLYLVELARALPAAASPAEEAPAEGADATLATEIVLPETLRGMLESRLDALEDEERELLALAACVGTEFDPVLVADALEASQIGTLKLLGRIERNHALIESAGRRYRFAHHLVQETLYAELHDALREACHGSIARALLRRENKAGLSADELPGPLATSVAHHALRSDDPAPGLQMAPRALRYLFESMDTQREEEIASALLALGDQLDAPMRARALLHLADAEFESESATAVLARVEEGLALLEGTPDPYVEPRLRAMRAFQLRGLGRFEEALGEYDRALDLAREAGDQAFEAQVLRGRGGTLRVLGRAEESLAAIKASLETALACGSVEEACSARNSLAIRLVGIGAYTIALDTYDEALASARACGKRTTESTILNNMSRTLYLLGRFEDAALRNAEALAVAREMGHVQLESRALTERALIAQAEGRYEDAVTEAATASRMVEAKEWWEEARATRLLHAELLFGSGDVDAASSQLDRAAEHEGRAPSAVIERHIAMQRAEIAAVCGDAEAAAARRREGEDGPALPVTNVGGYPIALSGVRLDLYAERYTEARATAEAALAALGERESRVHLAPMHALAAFAAFRLDDKASARTHAETARELATEMGAPWPAMLGEAVLSALGLEDALATRVRLESAGSQLPWWAAVLCWQLLFEATQADADRAHAVDAVATKAPYIHVLEAVPLFRRVAGGPSA
ncbi:MAG: protein kinase [Planctomycetota bacterium]|nr:protein kinase [Planctomycetota bacterium]